MLGLEWIARGIDGAHIVDQAVTHLSKYPGALWDTGQPGHQCGLGAALQHDRLIIAACLDAGGLGAALAPGEFAVTKHAFDYAVHFGHARSQACRHRRGQYIDHGLGPTGTQVDEQTLGHHHVADPGRGDDQNALAHASPSQRAASLAK